MAYALEADQTLDDNLRRIAREQLALAQTALDQAPPDAHEARKSLKRLRALVRLVREPLGAGFAEENTTYRDIGRALSGLRDPESLLELLPVLRKSAADVLSRSSLARLRAALRAELTAAPDAPEKLGSAREALAAAAERVAGWTIAEVDAAMLAAGAARSYRSARRRMREALASPSPETFHEWRKQAKHHAYQLRILQPVWPKYYGALSKTLDDLTDALGTEHDAALLSTRLEGELGQLLRPAMRLCWQTVCGQLQAEQRARAKKLGARVFGQSRAAFEEQLGASIAAWQADSSSRSTA